MKWRQKFAACFHSESKVYLLHAAFSRWQSVARSILSVQLVSSYWTLLVDYCLTIKLIVHQVKALIVPTVELKCGYPLIVSILP